MSHVQDRRPLFERLSILAGVFLVKLLLVWIAIPALSAEFSGFYNINHFPDGYDQIALNLVNGEGYRFSTDTAETLIRTPGFVLVLAGIFFVVGPSLAAVQLFNVLMSTITAWLISRFVGARFRLPWIQTLAPLMFLFHPGVLLAESRGGVESLFTLCLFGLVMVIDRIDRSLQYRDFVFAGFVLGLTLLVKSTVLVVPGLLMLCLLLRHREQGQALRIIAGTAIMVLLAGVVLSPWIVRNYRLTGEFRPTMTIKGFAAYQGYYLNKHMFTGKSPKELFHAASAEQNAIAEEMGLALKPGFFQTFHTTRDELVFYDELFSRVTQSYLDSPVFMARSGIANFLGFWFLGKSYKATVVNAVLTLPLLLLTIVGWRHALSRGAGVFAITLVAVAFVAPHLPVLGLARYHIPLVPMLAVFSAAGLVALAGSRFLVPKQVDQGIDVSQRMVG